MITEIIQELIEFIKRQVCWHKFYYVNTYDVCPPFKECIKCGYIKLI